MSTAAAAVAAGRQYYHGRCVSQERGCVRLRYAVAAAAAAKAARRDECVCGSHDSSHLLPAS